MNYMVRNQKQAYDEDGYPIRMTFLMAISNLHGISVIQLGVSILELTEP